MLQGTKVIVEIAGVEVKGVIVGKATTDINQTMIIECVDGFLPKDTYPYSHFVMPQSLIHVCKVEEE